MLTLKNACAQMLCAQKSIYSKLIRSKIRSLKKVCAQNACAKNACAKNACTQKSVHWKNVCSKTLYAKKSVHSRTNSLKNMRSNSFCTILNLSPCISSSQKFKIYYVLLNPKSELLFNILGLWYVCKRPFFHDKIWQVCDVKCKPAFSCKPNLYLWLGDVSLFLFCCPSRFYSKCK